jgi:hypothetical protein
MKRFYYCLMAINLLGCFLPAWASLRTLGEISEAGYRDADLSQLVILLEGCEWDGVVSHDGGKTWVVTRKEQLSAALTPLPLEGTVQFRKLAKGLVLKSTDAGTTWIDISPWPFLRKAIRDSVDAEKQRFLKKFGKWLPNDLTWSLSYGLSALLFCVVSARCCHRCHGVWVSALVSSLVSYLLIGTCLFAIHQFAIWTFNDQWNYRYDHWDNGIHFPLWPAGIALHLLGNNWLAPISAALCFPAVPLFNQAVTQNPESRWQKRTSLIGTFLVVGFVAFVFLAILFGRGWDYGV